MRVFDFELIFHRKCVMDKYIGKHSEKTFHRSQPSTMKLYFILFDMDGIFFKPFI